MIVDSLDRVYPQEYESSRRECIATAVDQVEQEDHPKALTVATQDQKDRTRPRLSVDEIMTFWSCLVPCGWSLGGLAAFLLSRQRKNAGRPRSVLSSILLGLLSTLCYLVAVLQAGKFVITTEKPQHKVATKKS